MYEQIYSTISMSNVLKILKNRYKKEYENYNNLSIDIYLKDYYRSYTDEYGFNEEEKGYELCCEISYNKIINNIILNGMIRKEDDEIKSDLYEELRKIYDDDEYKVDYFRLPEFKSPNIDLDSSIIIYFERTKQKVKKH